MNKNTERLRALESDVLAYLLYGPPRDLDEKTRIIEALGPENFRDEAAATVHAKIQEVFIETHGIDYTLVLARLKGQAATLAAMCELKDTLASIRYKVAELEYRARTDKVAMFCRQTLAEIDQDERQNYEKKVEDFLFSLGHEHQQRPIREVVSELVERGRSLKAGETLGFSWGSLPSLRRLTGGIERGKLYVIGASKKSGKSRFVISAIKALMDQGERPTFLSLEMREKDVTECLLAALLSLDTDIFHETLSEEVIGRIEAVMPRLEEGFYLDTETFSSLAKVQAKIWRAARCGSSVVMLDYLQRMEFPESRSKNHAAVIAETVARLADTAKKHNVALLLLSQVRNEAEGERIIDMRYLKDSGGIAEAADCIITINNRQRQQQGEEKYLPMKEVEVWFSVEQRSGQTGLVKTMARLGACEFREQDTWHEDPDRAGLERPAASSRFPPVPPETLGDDPDQ